MSTIHTGITPYFSDALTVYILTQQFHWWPPSPLQSQVVAPLEGQCPDLPLESSR